MTTALKKAQDLAEELIRNGNVDADNEGYDGVRALFQCLHGLPITGFTCDAIREVERTKGS